MTLEERPSKRARLLSDDEESDAEVEGGAKLDNSTPTLRINEEFAKRFEHNKKREEKQRLEEKYGRGKASGSASKEPVDGDETGDEDEDESSSDETEDDDAELIDEDVDREISETLQALRNKDPRIYDQSVKFYRDYDPEKTSPARVARKERPMYLQDYHRENLMAGHAGSDDAEAEDSGVPQTYAEEQDALRREMVGKMHAAAGGDNVDADDEDEFLVAKSKPKHETISSTAQKPRTITEEDVAVADKDPETYLSNFMAARGWRASEGSRFQPFDSDDSEDERRADVFEEAYNMRFEDPQTANETLKSYGRDVGKYGVRREEKSSRAKAREREREKKEAEKREREEEKARLRKLKIEEVEEKVRRIKEAAGLRGQEIDLQQWRDLIEGDFDDAQWDDEMRRRFGEQYYAENDGDVSGSEEDVDGKGHKGTWKKPKWDDDIDIKDLVPDFDEDEKPQFTLSDEDDEDGGVAISEEVADDAPGSKRKRKKDRQQEKAEAKRTARRERRAIEEMVDAALPFTHPALESSGGSKNPSVAFRYRATSPTSFGLTARDILFASDSQLNQYAGLKKLHAFRDSEKKQRDRKKLSKKARLRQWRKETFGKDEEPSGGFERVLRSEDLAVTPKPPQSGLLADGVAPGSSNIRDGERKKKRKRSKKSGTVAA